MFATVANRLTPEMVIPKKYALSVPPVIRSERGAVIDNRSKIRRIVTIWIAAVTVRVVGRISINAWKSDADTNRNTGIRFRCREQNETNREHRDGHELFHSFTSSLDNLTDDRRQSFARLFAGRITPQASDIQRRKYPRLFAGRVSIPIAWNVQWKEHLYPQKRGRFRR